jgi:hypothetical protein
MNPNDLLTQQQAYINQAIQNAQQWQIVYLVISLSMFIFGMFVIYMFYARLRDIADELRMLRIAYEMANPPATKSKSSSTSGNPFHTPPNA